MERTGRAGAHRQDAQMVSRELYTLVNSMHCVRIAGWNGGWGFSRNRRGGCRTHTRRSWSRTIASGFWYRASTKFWPATSTSTTRTLFAAIRCFSCRRTSRPVTNGRSPAGRHWVVRRHQSGGFAGGNLSRLLRTARQRSRTADRPIEKRSGRRPTLLAPFFGQRLEAAVSRVGLGTARKLNRNLR